MTPCRSTAPPHRWMRSRCRPWTARCSLSPPRRQVLRQAPCLWNTGFHRGTTHKILSPARGSSLIWSVRYLTRFFHFQTQNSPDSRLLILARGTPLPYGVNYFSLFVSPCELSETPSIWFLIHCF